MGSSSNAARYLGDSRFRNAYLASGYGGLVILDLRNSANPQRVGSYQTEGAAQSVAVMGNYVYLTDSSGLQIIDITTPATPRRVGGNKTSGRVSVQANFAYMLNSSAGLMIFELLQPPRLEAVGMFPSTGFHFTAQGIRGMRVQLQRSANLRAWLDWGAPLTLDASPIEYSDPDANAMQLFYRAVVP